MRKPPLPNLVTEALLLVGKGLLFFDVLFGVFFEQFLLNVPGNELIRRKLHCE